MNKIKNLYFLFLLFGIFQIQAQKLVSIKGIITDNIDLLPISGVTISIDSEKKGSITNTKGMYQIKISRGKYILKISHLGYESVIDTIDIQSDINKNYRLKLQEIHLSEVEVGLDKENNLKRKSKAVISLPVSTIRKIPSLAGEIDIVKSLLYFPGVSSASESVSGFNVRGGSADQNLVLLDRAVIFNPIHLFGFLSSFNSDAIGQVNLYKGGIEPIFGGRISSVLDIHHKKSDFNNTNFLLSIGAISSKFLLQTPIMKEKNSLLIAARASYAHLFLKLTSNKNSAYFYDFNTKFTHQFKEGNTIYFSTYLGRDYFSLNKNLTNFYGNTIFNIRWEKFFSSNIVSNLSAFYSDYSYGFLFDYVGFEWQSAIKDIGLRYDFINKITDKISISYGVQSDFYQFLPGKLNPIKENIPIVKKEIPKKIASEYAAYLGVEQNITSNISVSYGVRWTGFHQWGKRNINSYKNDQAVVFNKLRHIYEKATPIGIIEIGSVKNDKFFLNFEPRLSFSYQFSPRYFFRANYMKMTQYIHLISNTTSPTPIDVWSASDFYIPPQYASQYSIGNVLNFKKNKYNFEFDVYYKNVKNKLEYIDGADLIANSAIEQVVLPSQMRAYGAEFFLKKNEGKLTGWLSYTLSRSEQQTPGRSSEEIGINNGNWYKTPFDRLHNLSLTAIYSLSEKWSFSGIFTYQSGIPANFPIGKYEYFGVVIPNYSSRNEYRLPVYHRLDIALTYSLLSKNERIKKKWNFGIYNLYNRKNAMSISFRKNSDTQKNEAVKLSIFGIVPSVSYELYF